MLITSLSALASFEGGGDRVGNGGDVIVCPGERTEVLDLFQGRNDWGFQPRNNPGTRDEIINTVLGAFIKVDPKIGEALKARALQLSRELALLEQDSTYRSTLVKLTPNELINISDEGVAELPPGCKLIQAATQITVPFPNEVKFTFQKTIWDSLDVDVQSSLILHETIYEHMLRSGENSSRSTRYMNATLHAGALDTAKGYFEVSSLFGFRNLAIVDDGVIHIFGAAKKCSVQMKYSNVGDNHQLGTNITVNRRNVATNAPSFRDAMNLFWNKYVANGACD